MIKYFYSAYHYRSGKIFYFVKKPIKRDLLKLAKKYEWDIAENPAEEFEITICEFAKQGE